MALAVVTVASGGMAVVDVSADAVLNKISLGVSEAANARGIPVTKVTAPKAGLAVIYVVPPP